MNYLIDTHILLWYIAGDKRINSEIQNKIDNELSSLFLSNASLWEIAIKVSIEKLKLKGSIIDLKTLKTYKRYCDYPFIIRILLIG